LNSYERVVRAIEFDGPDRIPITHGWVAPAALCKYGSRLRRIFTKYPSDLGDYEIGGSLTDASYIGGEDEWGCVWEVIREGIIGQVKKHPLADWRALETYLLPKPQKPERRYRIGSGGNLFERMQWLRGFEKLMMDLITRRKELYILRDRIVNYNLEMAKISLESGVDAIAFGDDWGTQNRLMISPSLWREVFKPAYKRMFDTVHKRGAHVYFHSDGYVLDIIPDLIEIGVDIFNDDDLPINDVDKLGERFGGKICFASGGLIQSTFAAAKREEIVIEAKRIMSALGSHDGGYIAGCQMLEDVPLTNVETLYKTFWKHGRYPIRNSEF